MRISQTGANSAELSFKDRTEFPAEALPRMLRDNMLVEPLEVTYSAIIKVIHETKPLLGIVRAVGPGHYPKIYNGPKGKRTKSWDSKIFQKTTCKVGDKVYLGGEAHGGYNFQTMYWGDKLMICCREADVCGIVIE